MPIDIIRILLVLIIRAYAVLVVFFGAYSMFFEIAPERKRKLFNVLNVIGLCLALLMLHREILNLTWVTDNNYVRHWRAQPYYYIFRYLSVASILLCVIVLISKDRRQKLVWSFVALFFLVFPLTVAYELESWLIGQYYRK